MGDPGSIPGLGRSPGEGKGLENSMDYTVHGVAKNGTQLSDFHFTRKPGKVQLILVCIKMKYYNIAK